jgi:hypothetical protein
LSCHDLFVRTHAGDGMHLWSWSGVSMSAWDVVMSDVDEDADVWRLGVCHVSLKRFDGGENVNVVKIVVEVVGVVKWM